MTSPVTSPTTRGLDVSKLEEVPAWRDSEVFTELERVALENHRSRINSALGLTSQGFKDRCELTG